MDPPVSLKYDIWPLISKKPWSSRTPVFMTLERTPGPCSSVSPSDTPRQTGGHLATRQALGVGPALDKVRGLASSCLCLEPWPGRGVGVTLLALRHPMQPEPIKGRESTGLSPTENTWYHQGNQGQKAKVVRDPPGITEKRQHPGSRNSFQLGGAGWPGWRGCHEDGGLSGSGLEGWADGAGKKGGRVLAVEAVARQLTWEGSKTMGSQNRICFHDQPGSTSRVEFGSEAVRGQCGWNGDNMGGTCPDTIELHSAR